MRIILLLFFLTSLQAMSKAPPQTEIVSSIGVRTVQYQDAKRKNRPVLVEVWYPTHQSGPIDEPEDVVWIHPEEIRDVIPCYGRHPLVVMSHGHGGDRRDRSWLVEYLVKSGFIVASVEHYGNSWRSYNPLITLKFWERSKDVSFAISKILRDPFFRNRIDRHKIGFIGYSLGGMTGLSLAGARAHNVKEVVKQYQSTIKEIDPKLIDTVNFDEGHANFYDRRIKAHVLLSPAAFVYPPKAFKHIKAPIALVASEGDEILPIKDHALKVVEYLGTAKLKLLKDKISHYVFLNRVSDAGKKIAREEIQKEKIQRDRLEVHQEVGAFVVDFFQEHLN